MITKFLIKVMMFSALLLVAILGVFCLEEGQSDSFYLRFATPQQRSLILGNSRAAQGLVPHTIDSSLIELDYPPIFNYSFTITSSPFGRVYLESIKRKLIQSENHNGLFIVVVDPWSISVNKSDPNIEEHFPEHNNYLAKIRNVSTKPNLDYLLNFYGQPYYNILLRKVRPNHLHLHDNGWLEVTVSMKEKIVNDRTKQKIKNYAADALNFKYSETRIKALGELINFLGRHGDVYLVRLPVHPDVRNIEDGVVSDFDAKINSLAGHYNVPYLNMNTSPGPYQFTDGNHLYKRSSIEVSRQVANWIKKLKKPEGYEESGTIATSN